MVMDTSGIRSTDIIGYVTFKEVTSGSQISVSLEGNVREPPVIKILQKDQEVQGNSIIIDLSTIMSTAVEF